MKKLLLCSVITACALGLSGCATLSDAKIGKTLCANQLVSRAALNLKTAEDSKIKDDALRQAALSLDADALAILNACPPASNVQVPVPVSTTPAS